MDALVDIDLIEKSSRLTASVIVIVIVKQVNLLFLDGADKALRVAALRVPGSTRLGHANASADLLEHLDVGQGRVLNPL